MTNLAKNDSLRYKEFITLVIIICSWFYLFVCFGYYLAKLFYNSKNKVDKTSTFKSIQFRKRFNLKFVISYLFKFLKNLLINWAKRIREKYRLVRDAIYKLIKAIRIFRKKFRFRSISKYRYNFRLLKILLSIFLEALGIFYSFINEIFFLHNMVTFISKWRQLIILLMAESIWITRAIYFLYLIFLGLLGTVLGFLIGLYDHEDEIYVFILLYLLKLIYKNRHHPLLLELWQDLFLKPDIVEDFSTMSGFKTIEQTLPRPSQIMLKEPDQRSGIPFPILGDPFVWIDVNLSWEESHGYKFELFEFYQDVAEKVKS